MIVATPFESLRERIRSAWGSAVKGSAASVIVGT